TNMTAGAVPDYVKLTAAIFADGSTAGVPEKVTQFIDRRRAVLATTRDLISRLEKGATKEDLMKWADSLQPMGKAKLSVNQTAAKSLITETAAKPAGEALATLRASEKALATSKPVL
ncbi:MAG: hypothetical protein ABSF22_19715, partial [Bryobacteraceae bacterium]